MPDFSRASWRLKLARAEHHLRELETKIRDYADGDPYEARREHKGKPNRDLWRYVVRFTDKPDPEIAVVMGDVLHNLRSALDHIAVAVAPCNRKWDASFPIISGRIENKGGVAVFEKDEERKRFAHATKGMPDQAVAIIRALQPGSRSHASRNVFALLSGFHNADKHHDLVPVTVALTDVSAFAMRGSMMLDLRSIPTCYNGTEVLKFVLPPPAASESEVQVYVSGTAKIAVGIGLPKRFEGYVEVLPVLVKLTRILPRLFTDLEPFARE